MSITKVSTTEAMSTTITNLNTKFSQANYSQALATNSYYNHYHNRATPSVRTNYYKVNFTSTVHLVNKTTTTTATTLVAVTIPIKPTTTANTKPKLTL